MADVNVTDLRQNLPSYLDRARRGLEPLTHDIAERAGQLGDAFPGDSADRLIAATALVHPVPLGTYDEKLRETDFLPTIW
jgi:PIN domain nuclease of toxin-antitoxin system